ncbi:hypothetical protein N7478_002068 [Penicillium angulare]|uniref:uncharacterized protein n=1 Tax=Penicillium angulare TaxID=116970 RepID=UPI0025418E7B|nr:uncharacterized protein N7478_002068 [Penicillium angulare]KAJ5289038.1 hypothetical protein N7478_002068 [Penicillium angulare]
MDPTHEWFQTQMPGFNVPLNAAPAPNINELRRSWFPIDFESSIDEMLKRGATLTHISKGFYNALDPNHLHDSRLDKLLVKREIIMMQIMNTITDKPEWERKVCDETITNKWHEEIAQSGQDVTPKMMDWVIKELQWKKSCLEKNGYLEVFENVIKSDTAISKELQDALKGAVNLLEDVLEDQKDYHPGSDDKVLDLVHPSLFPVLYGKTRVLPDKILGIEDCLDYIGEGEVLPTPPDSESEVNSSDKRRRRGLPKLPMLSMKFQWMPCDIDISKDGECRILSYINNAHPVKHRALYQSIEKIISRTVPLWEASLTEKNYPQRISYKDFEWEEGYGYGEFPEWDEKEEEYDGKGDFQEHQKHIEDQYKRQKEYEATRKVKIPEPGEFKIPDPKNDRVKPINFRTDFCHRKLQVIVKLANIELTPGKPEYEGGSWHIEGQLNERIVASAIYYYDSDNITDSSLAFRHRGMTDHMNDLGYEQDQHQFMQQVYGYSIELENNSPCLTTQELGSVVTKEGRLITFPNTLQHCVSPFSLEDRSKPGHRKILALFLVDPHRRVISSANVPPQQENWKKSKETSTENETPVESQSSDRPAKKQKVNQVETETVDCSAMSLEEAKAYRLELMKERGLKSAKQNKQFQEGHFSLCEH